MESKLQTLLQEWDKIKLVERRLNRVKQHIRILQDEVKIKADRVSKEYDDIIKLESTTLGDLFSSILSRNKEEQLEVERQEYLQAVLSFEALKNEIEVLKFEEDLLEGKMASKNQIENQYNSALKLEEQRLTLENPSLGIEINSLNRKIEQYGQSLIEIDEVLLVGNLLLSNLKEVSKLIKGVAAMYDRNYTFHQSAKKISKIVASLNVLFNKYFQEMEDVYPDLDLDLSISGFKVQRFVSSFYDRMVRDYVSPNYRKSTINEIEFAIDKIKGFQESLKLEKVKNLRLHSASKIDKKQLILDNTIQ